MADLRNKLEETISGFCSICHKKSSLKCSRCSKVFYCSTTCQKDDWPKHKIKCSPNNKKIIRKEWSTNAFDFNRFPSCNHCKQEKKAKFLTSCSSCGIRWCKQKCQKDPTNHKCIPSLTNYINHFHDSADKLNDILFFFNCGNNCRNEDLNHHIDHIRQYGEIKDQIPQSNALMINNSNSAKCLFINLIPNFDNEIKAITFMYGHLESVVQNDWSKFEDLDNTKIVALNFMKSTGLDYNLSIVPCISFKSIFLENQSNTCAIWIKLFDMDNKIGLNKSSNDYAGSRWLMNEPDYPQNTECFKEHSFLLINQKVCAFIVQNYPGNYNYDDWLNSNAMYSSEPKPDTSQNCKDEIQGMDLFLEEEHNITNIESKFKGKLNTEQLSNLFLLLDKIVSKHDINAFSDITGIKIKKIPLKIRGLVCRLNFEAL